MNYSSQEFKLAVQATMQACDELHLVKGFLPTDTYAEAIAKSIGSAAMVSGDYTFTEDTTDDADGTGAKITFAAKSTDRTGVCVPADDMTMLFVNTGTTTYHFGNNITGLDVTTENTGVSVPSFSTTLRNPA